MTDAIAYCTLLHMRVLLDRTGHISANDPSIKEHYIPALNHVLRQLEDRGVEAPVNVPGWMTVPRCKFLDQRH